MSSEEFNSNGVIVVRQLMPVSIIQTCLDDMIHLSSWEKPLHDKVAVFDEDGKGQKYLKYFQHPNLYVPSFWKLFDSRLSDVAREILNQGVYFYGQGMHDKAPHGGTFTPVHQDNYYWCLQPADALTAYVVLEEQSTENGGITYYEKSHKLGTLDHAGSMVAAFSSQLSANFEPEKWNCLRPTLKPGDVVFHHCNLIHGADANMSARNRRAVSVSIYGEKAEYSKSMAEVYEKNRRANRRESA